MRCSTLLVVAVACLMFGCSKTQQNCLDRKDIIFVVDSSDEVARKGGLSELQGFLETVVNQLRIDDAAARVGVFMYGDAYAEPGEQFYIAVDRSTNHNAVVSAIRNLRILGGSTSDPTTALSYILDNIVERGRQAVIIILMSMPPRRETGFINLLQEAQRDGHIVLPVGLGDRLQPQDLAGYALADANVVPSRYWSVNDVRDLPGITNSVVQTLCLSALTGNNVPGPQIPNYSKALDLVIMLDASEEAGPVFSSMLTFAASVVSMMTQYRTDMRVGVLTYRENADNQFYLNDATDPGDIRNRILSLSNFRTGGRANLAEALRSMRVEQFTYQKGDRSTASNIALLLAAQSSYVSPDEEGRLAQSEGITLIPIGVTRQVDSNELALISAGSHTEAVDYFILRNPGDFPDTITSQTRDLMVGIASPIVPQPVPVPVPSPVPAPVPSNGLIDLVFVVETSISMTATYHTNPQGTTNWDIVKDNIASLITRMTRTHPHTGVAVIFYHQDVSTVINWNRYTLEALAGVIRQEDISRTATATVNTREALEEMMSLFRYKPSDRRGTRNVCVLIQSDDSDSDVSSYADEARRNDISIYPVGLTNRVDSTQLERLASYSQQPARSWALPDFTSLTTTADDIYRTIFYGEDVIPAPVPVPVPAPTVISKAIDVVFAFDGSDNTRFSLTKLPLMKQFMIDVVSRFNVGERYLKVGMIEYSTRASSEFYLNTYSQQLRINNAIDSLRLTSGSANIAEAIRVSMSDQFVDVRGERRTAPDVLVLITDSSADNMGSTIQAAAEAKTRGITIILLGITAQFRMQDAIDITKGQRNENYMLLSDYQELSAHVPLLIQYMTDATCATGPVGRDGATGRDGLDGIPGTDGERGDMGYVGAPGDPGLQGSRGDPGYDGVQGATGFPGSNGRSGRKGAVGPTGRPGLRGRDGFPGRDGNTGAPGTPGGSLPGPIGPAGPTGDQGISGRDGRPGADGPDGFSGLNGEKGERGYRGADGRSGGVGVPGFPGPKGRQGYPGAKGFNGLPGDNGFPGIDGDDGLQGPDGLPGVNGVPGNRGPTGDDGDDGPQGVRGDIGPRGFPGPTGRDGRNGIPGEQGDTGPQGFSGGEGRRGLDGAAGAPGFDGTPGSKGFPGQQGDTGYPGSDGAPGFDGRQGDTGLSGIPGRQGYTGLQGRNGFQGDTGEQGFPGPDAATGETGRPGEPGVRGSDGEDGRPGRIGIPGDDGDTGERGRPGPQGPAGVPGDKGFAGLEGGRGINGIPGDSIVGVTGPVGFRGVPGEQGFRGNPGTVGSDGAPGVPGRRGLSGAVGHTGPPGPIGLSGDLGSTGFRGPNGLDGGIGLQGSPGATGATGTRGRQGPEGPTGRVGLPGRVGDEGRQGLRGAPGRSGLVGPRGLNGLPGRRGRNGPNGVQGIPGRKGVRGLTGRVGLRGTTGRQGDTGVRGLPGANGLRGLTGLPGPTGFTGPTGNDGRRGADGIIGRVGPRGENGVPGAVGRPGIVGIPGAKGEPGNSGRTGRIGPKGDTGMSGLGGLPGAKGQRGRVGPVGSTGFTGAPGRSGAPGFQGPHGAPGLPGFPGVDGPDGPTGERGQIGQFGPPGAKGERGPVGFSGRQGDTGDQGFAGRDGVDGLRGADGRPGIDGRLGTRGSDGFPGPKGQRGNSGFSGGDGVPGTKGERGFNGAAGRNGDTGAPGRSGARGEDGRSGRNGNPGNPGLKGFPGVPGTDGLNGRSGSPGRKGSKGLRGFSGQQGYTGFQGPSGFPGVKGIQGPNGIGYPGNKGDRGLNGLNGDIGSQGRNGVKGPQGFNGGNGRAGFRGEQGDTGFRGTGYIGSAGADGSEGPTGFTGDRGLNGDIGDTGERGRPGPDGLNGLQGPPGFAGGCPEINSCLPNNGDCQQLCTKTYDSHYCSCSSGYAIQDNNLRECPSQCDNTVADIVFLLDASDNIGNNWQTVVNFVDDIVGRFSISRDRTQVSVIVYGGFRSRVIIRLDRYTNKPDLLDAVRDLAYNFQGGSDVNVALSLEQMMSEIFTSPNGDRSFAENICILVTSGQSSRYNSQTITAANIAHTARVNILVAAVEQAVEQSWVAQVASSPHRRGQNYFTSSVGRLRDNVEPITRNICPTAELYCRFTAEVEDYMCYCRYSQCDVRPLNSTQCVDVNECRIDNGGCEFNCINTVGSHMCTCPAGLSLSGNGKNCKDINECVMSDTACGSQYNCLNTYGSFKCITASNLQTGSNQPLVQNSELAASSGSGYSNRSLLLVSIVGGVIGVMLAIVAVLTKRAYTRMRRRADDLDTSIDSCHSTDTGIDTQSDGSISDLTEMPTVEL